MGTAGHRQAGEGGVWFQTEGDEHAAGHGARAPEARDAVDDHPLTRAQPADDRPDEGSELRGPAPGDRAIGDGIPLKGEPGRGRGLGQVGDAVGQELMVLDEAEQAACPVVRP